MGLLGNQVAESMTHPDARELSSLIINTLGSYELKKGCGRGWWCMSLICPPPLPPSSSLFPILSPSSSVVFLICNRTERSFGYFKKRLKLAGKASFQPSILLQSVGSRARFCSWKLRGSLRGFHGITRNGRNCVFSL